MAENLPRRANCLALFRPSLPLTLLTSVDYVPVASSGRFNRLISQPWLIFTCPLSVQFLASNKEINIVVFFLSSQKKTRFIKLQLSLSSFFFVYQFLLKSYENNSSCNHSQVRHTNNCANSETYMNISFLVPLLSRWGYTYT